MHARSENEPDDGPGTYAHDAPDERTRFTQSPPDDKIILIAAFPELRKRSRRDFIVGVDLKYPFRTVVLFVALQNGGAVAAIRSAVDFQLPMPLRRSGEDSS